MQRQPAQVSREGTGQLEPLPLSSPLPGAQEISLSFPSRLEGRGTAQSVGSSPQKPLPMWLGEGERLKSVFGGPCVRTAEKFCGSVTALQSALQVGNHRSRRRKDFRALRRNSEQIHTLRPSERWPRGGWGWAWEGHLEGAPRTSRAPAVWRQSGTHPPGRLPQPPWSRAPQAGREGRRAPPAPELLRAGLSGEVTRSRRPGDFGRRVWQS